MRQMRCSLGFGRFILVLRDLEETIELIFTDQCRQSTRKPRPSRPLPPRGFLLPLVSATTFLAGASTMLSLPATVRYLVSIVDTCSCSLMSRRSVVDRAPLAVRKEHPQHHRRIPKLRSWFRPTPGSATNLGIATAIRLTKFSTVETNNKVLTRVYTSTNQQGKSRIGLRHDSTCLMRIICFPTCAQRTAVKYVEGKISSDAGQVDNYDSETPRHPKRILTNMYSEKLQKKKQVPNNGLST